MEYGRVSVDDHSAVSFHLPQLLDEHFLRNSWDRPFQLREAQHFSTEQVKENDQLPPTLQNSERILYALSGRDGRVRLTFR